MVDEEQAEEEFGPEMLIDADVKIHEFGDHDLKGAKVVDGFPSVGLVSTIAANYLIDMLKLEQIGIVDSRHFPTLSVVHAGEPLNPVRIYGGEHADKEGNPEKIVVFISEFQPAPFLVRPIAEAILDWTSEKGVDIVISPEGLVLEEDDGGYDDGDVEVYAIGSTAETRALIEERDVTPFTHGIITGVSGVLLNIGKRERLPVVSILAEAHANYPDARSAATVIETIGKLLNIEINVEPLYKEAEGFEKQIRSLQKQAHIADRKTGGGHSPSMYG